MAASWISSTIASGLQSVIQPGVAAAGSFAGGAVSSVGAGVNGVGESINGYVRRYGTGIQDYGNSIRDWTAAEGPRAQTATNPLGLSSSMAGGKHRVRNPQLGPKMAASESNKASPTPKSATSKTKGGTMPKNIYPGRVGGHSNSQSVRSGTDAKRSSAVLANRSVGSTGSMSSSSTSNKKANNSPRLGTSSSGQKNASSKPAGNATGKAKISPESRPRNLNSSGKWKAAKAA